MIFLFGLNDNAQIKQPNIIQNNNVKEPKQPVETIRLNSNTIVAQTIVQKILFNINMCLNFERSKMKLNSLDKFLVKQAMSQQTIAGIVHYVANMYDKDIDTLMDDIMSAIPTQKLQDELKKRPK